jgi:hypothetical protein
MSREISMANATNLTKPEDGTTGKLYNYLCYGHPLDVCFDKDFFRSMRGNFLPGDKICLMEFDTKNPELREQVLRSMCEGIVVSIRNDTVDFRPLGNSITRFKDIDETEEVIEPGFDEPAPEFIKSEDAKVKWIVGSRSYHVIADGLVVADVKDKADAYSIARGDLPLPALTAEV